MVKTRDKIIVAGMSALMLGGSVLGTAGTALAAPGVTGNITINKVEGNTSEKVRGVQLFKGDVSDGEQGKVVHNVEWANDDIKNIVETAIKAQDKQYTGTTAQDAAEWLQQKLGSDSSKIVQSYEEGTAILKALSQAQNVKWQDVALGSSVALAEGLWLFNPQSPAPAGNGAGTSPILAVVGGQDVVVKEKVSIPKVDKKIVNEADRAAGVGDLIAYDLKGTVAGNIDTYDSYKYQFKDTLSEKFGEYQKDSVEVYIGTDKEEGQKVTSGYTVNVDNSGAQPSLTVDFKDLKQAYTDNDPKNAVTIDASTVVRVKYKVKVLPGVKLGSKPNVNDVVLTYSHDPYSEDTGTTTSTEKFYSYKVTLVKKDSSTNTPLQGAKFTIKVKSSDNTDKVGKYLNADGSVGGTDASKAYQFTSDEKGQISVEGIDAGTYTLHEVEAPQGYTAGNDVDFVITPTLNGENVLQSVTTSATMQGVGDEVVANAAELPGSEGLSFDYLNRKDIQMPLTGMSGVGAFVIVGGAVLAISAVAYAASARKAQN